MDKLLQHLTKELNYYMVDNKLSVNVLATKIGKTRQTASAYVNGRGTVEQLIETLISLGCEIDVMVRR